MTPAQTELLILETWDFADPAASYEEFQIASDQAGGNTAPGLVLQTQAARALGLQGFHDGALAALDSIEADLAVVAGIQARNHVQARLEIERGRIHNSAGRHVQALPFFDRAYEYASTAKVESLAVDALHMTAIAIGHTDGPEAAKEWNQRAIEEAGGSSDPAARRWFATLLNNMGWDYHESGSFTRALSYFEGSLAARQEHGSAREIAIARWTVARALRSMHRYEEALAIQDELAERPESVNDGYVHEERGELLVALRRQTEAAEAFARAHELMSQDPWFVKNHPERLSRMSEFQADEPVEPTPSRRRR